MSIVIDCGRHPCVERERGLVAATSALRRGELCVVPTEVAYGLAADAFSARGVARLREVKGRGDQVPVPVLVASARMAEAIVTGLDASTRRLMEACWPGPLTLVARQQPTLSWTLGGDTVSVRMPLHPLLLELITASGPLAVSTANRAGAAPPRTLAEAQAQVGDDAKVYLDAGPAGAHEASSVVDVTGEVPVLLRAGAFDLEALRALCPDLHDPA